MKCFTTQARVLEMILRVMAFCCLLMFAGVARGERSFEIREKITYSTVGDRKLLLDAFHTERRRKTSSRVGCAWWSVAKRKSQTVESLRK